ncbi:hypothetical protein [Rhodohalobacter sp. 614A]|uniref:hypothetical protein n=1 Tax=Rhodohalobacter sp. 614A TaxID=2908649 RepID=UPI001F2ECBBB|nr:hypothetical protein [Rhodohalobacter sp. 614A]
MTRFVKWLLGIILLLAFIIGTFFWFEAEKEVRILCSMFKHGQSTEQVIRTLNTGHHLEYVHQNNRITVDSPKTLGTAKCTIQFSEIGQVLSSEYTQSFSLNKTAAWIGSFGFFGMIFFQLLLALGFPYGKLAWGGFYEILPVSLRIGSGIAVFVYSYGIIVLFESAQIIQLLNKPELVEYSVWIFSLQFGLSTIGNLQSKSEMEKKIMTPIGILFCCLCLTVGMTG